MIEDDTVMLSNIEKYGISDVKDFNDVIYDTANQAYVCREDYASSNLTRSFSEIFVRNNEDSNKTFNIMNEDRVGYYQDGVVDTKNRYSTTANYVIFRIPVEKISRYTKYINIFVTSPTASVEDLNNVATELTGQIHELKNDKLDNDDMDEYTKELFDTKKHFKKLAQNYCKNDKYFKDYTQQGSVDSFYQHELFLVPSDAKKEKTYDSVIYTMKTKDKKTVQLAMIEHNEDEPYVNEKMFDKEELNETIDSTETKDLWRYRNISVTNGTFNLATEKYNYVSYEIKNKKIGTHTYLKFRVSSAELSKEELEEIIQRVICSIRLESQKDADAIWTLEDNGYEE